MVVFLLLSSAKEQYFIPGRRGHQGQPGWDGASGWAGGWGGQARGAGQGCWQPSAPGLCPLPTGTEDHQLNSECNSDVVCPHKCRCEASLVECSSLKLTKIPERIPQATAEL